jgi:glycosyltransferase 2 family protein
VSELRDGGSEPAAARGAAEVAVRDSRVPRGKAWIAMAAKLAFSIALMALLVSRIPLDQVAAAIRRADPRWLGVAFGVMLLSNVLGAWQWQHLLRTVEIRIPFWKVCAYYHVGLFFNNFLPANIGGDIARVLDASRHGPSRTTAVSSVIMDRLIGTVALAGLALITAAPAIDQFHLTLVYLALVGFFCLSVGVVWTLFHPRLVPGIERLAARFGLRAIGPHLDDFAAKLHRFRGRRTLFLALLLLALVVQVLRVAVHVLVGHALGLAIPVAYFLLFVPLLAVIVSLPISFNGIGVREGAGVVLFGLVGVGRAEAFSLQFTTYLIAVAVSLLGGLVFLARIPRRRAEHRSLWRSKS